MFLDPPRRVLKRHVCRVESRSRSGVSSRLTLHTRDHSTVRNRRTEHAPRAVRPLWLRAARRPRSSEEGRVWVCCVWVPWPRLGGGGHVGTCTHMHIRAHKRTVAAAVPRIRSTRPSRTRPRWGPGGTPPPGGAPVWHPGGTPPSGGAPMTPDGTPSASIAGGTPHPVGPPIRWDPPSDGTPHPHPSPNACAAPPAARVW